MSLYVRKIDMSFRAIVSNLITSLGAIYLYLAELAEIDENIVRTALSVIKYGELLERRKEIYEVLHPEIRASQTGPSATTSATLKSFT